MLTVTLAHCRGSRERREMLPDVLSSWEGRVQMVVCDDHFAGSWKVVRAAWEEALELSGRQGHLCVGQDDFEMAKGGAELIEGLCERYPDRVWSFRWCDASEAWMEPWVESLDEALVEVASVWSGGCAFVPAPIIEDFLAWSVQYERVLRSSPFHKSDYVEDVLRSRDDFRFDLYLLARDIPVYRSRWSLLEHLGDVSIVRQGVRPPSVEVNLVHDVVDLPKADDPRWAGEDAPCCRTAPASYRHAVESLFGSDAAKLGLEHLRW